jgi:hypothetical protein
VHTKSKTDKTRKMTKSWRAPQVVHIIKAIIGGKCPTAGGVQLEESSICRQSSCTPPAVGITLLQVGAMGEFGSLFGRL